MISIRGLQYREQMTMTQSSLVNRYTPGCVCVERGEQLVRLNGTLSHWYAHNTRLPTSSSTYLYVCIIAGTHNKTYVIHILYYIDNYWVLDIIVVCDADWTFVIPLTARRRYSPVSYWSYCKFDRYIISSPKSFIVK